ncbi:hypothetical protein B0H14DRAFT_3494712 [Mycena olivaceomarginata]|nr:hypothetical protein B0H14DRAFT_3494712 [Mycena olivaceomarginata]
MSSPLRNFALFWNFGLCFFLNPRTSPHRRLDWDTQNLHMERVLLWLSRMGFGVSWSERYDQLLVRLFPEVYPDTPEAHQKSNLAGLRSRLLSFSRPEAGPRHGPAPFEAPPELASSDGQWNSLEGTARPGHILVGDELDLKIIAADLSPSDFLGATLPTLPPPPLPTPSLSPPATRAPSPPPITVLEADKVSPAPTPSPPPAPSGRKRARTKGKWVCNPEAFKSGSSQYGGRKPPTIPPIVSSRGIAPKRGGGDPVPTLQALQQQRTVVHLGGGTPVGRQDSSFSNAYEDGDDEVLRGLLVLLWEHFGDGSFLPLQPDPRWSDLTQTRLSTTYREFLLLRPVPGAASASAPRRPAALSSCSRGPTVHVSSGSEAGSSEDETPAYKKPDDPRNYDLEEEDVQMSSPESSIAADECNYDSGLEPAPAVVPPEQQVSSSRVTLDDPPPFDARFLGFRPRSATEITSASRASLVEIVQQSAANTKNEEQLENALLTMSEVFGQAGKLLGRRRRGDKGKGKGRAL